MEMSDQSSEQSSRDQDRRTPQWNSNEDSLGFEHFEKRLKSSILRKTTTVKNPQGNHTYNIGSTIVYLIDLVTRHGSRSSTLAEDTMKRTVNPTLVASPKERIIAMILSTESPTQIPSDCARIIKVVEQLASNGEVQDSPSEPTKSSDELLDDLDVAIEHDLAWLLDSPMAMLLLNRETPFIEPNSLSKFTRAETLYNGDLLLQLQQGAITGSATSIFESA